MDDNQNNGHDDDDFDLARLRLPQNFADVVGVKKALLTVPVRKPDRQDFVRVHPGEDYRITAAVIELRDDRKTYLVDPVLCSEIPGEVTPKLLLTTITRQGVLFLWPIRLPAEDGRLDEWSRSAFQATELAVKHWVRVAANMALGAYEVFQARGALPDPDWPDVDFQTIVRTAFKDQFIQSLDHPVIRRLRGGI
jgi:hypothetical protein